MAIKEDVFRDRLIVALDLPSVDEAHAMVKRISGAATNFKIGYQLALAGGIDLARELKAEGKKVFLDMKLLDIDNTGANTYSNNRCRTSTGAPVDCGTAVSLPAMPQIMSAAAVSGRAAAQPTE